MIRHVLPLLLLLMPLSASTADVYRCVTENGVIRYSDKPCADGKTDKLAIRSRPTDREAVQDRIENRKEQIKALEESDAKTAEAASKATEEKARRKQQCAVARERLQNLNAARRVTSGQGDDKRFLEADEIEARRKQAADRVAELCSGQQ